MSSESIIPVTYRRSRTMADGSIRVEVDIEPRHALGAFTLFHEPGVMGALARLTQEAAAGHQQRQAFAEPSPKKGPHGQFWRAMFTGAVFQAPPILAALGTDAEFNEFIRRHTCEVCGQYAYRREADQEWVTEAAHVRRVADGAGTGIKNTHATIPLCTEHHRAQHQQGESAIGGADWCDRTLAGYRNAWARERLHERFGVESLTHLAPADFLSWLEACDHRLLRFIPDGYRRASA
jgi:hypothetical protein